MEFVESNIVHIIWIYILRINNMHFPFKKYVHIENIKYVKMTNINFHIFIPSEDSASIGVLFNQWSWEYKIKRRVSRSANLSY